MQKTFPNELSKENNAAAADCCPVFIKYFEGYKYHEIAESLNLPLSEVKERVKINKKKLRANFRVYVRAFKTSHFFKV